MEQRLEFIQKKVLVTEKIGTISAEVIIPEDAIAMLTLAHGAGTDMFHSFLQELSVKLADNRIATTRFNFPYTENRKKAPDRPPVATATVKAIVELTHREHPNLPVFLSGKSFGGRMSSQLLAEFSPDFVRGIIFYGFPLHPAGNPSVERADHLKKITVPMLFLQGTKDALAYIDLIEQVTDSLPNATLVKFEGADHSFKKGKSLPMDLLVTETRNWVAAKL